MAEDKFIYEYKYCPACKSDLGFHECYEHKEYLIIFINLYGEVIILKRYSALEWEKLLSKKEGNRK
jgi:hypothetical protein